MFEEVGNTINIIFRIISFMNESSSYFKLETNYSREVEDSSDSYYQQAHYNGNVQVASQK